MKNRWLIAASAVGIHLSIGSIYAWSILNQPLLKTYGLDPDQLYRVTFTFTLVNVVVGLAAAFLGRYIEKFGPRKSGIVAAFLFGLGLAGSGLAVKFGSIKMLYFFYGIVGGTGMGIAYIAPVPALIKWFPDRRGLATGMAIMGFGFASFVARYLMAHLLAVTSIEIMFYVIGAIYFAVIFICSLYLELPPAEYTQAMASRISQRVQADHHSQPIAQLTASAAVRTRRFYYLWFLLFINVTCGIAVISVAKDMGAKVAMLSDHAAGMMVAFMGIFNGLGRIGWSTLSDYFGRTRIWIAFFVIQILVFFSLTSAVQYSPLLFQILVFIMITCYGGGFATVPAYITDLFGTRNVAAIHGLSLTAWSAAGIAGPMLISLTYKRSGSFDQALFICGFLLIIALIVTLLLMADIARVKKKNLTACD